MQDQKKPVEKKREKKRDTTTIELLPPSQNPKSAKYVVKFGGSIVKFLFSDEEKKAYEEGLVVTGKQRSRRVHNGEGFSGKFRKGSRQPGSRSVP